MTSWATFSYSNMAGLTMRPAPANTKRRRPHESIASGGTSLCVLLAAFAELAAPSFCFQPPILRSRFIEPFQITCSTCHASACKLQAPNIESPLESSALSDFDRPYPNVIFSTDSPRDDSVEVAAQYLSRYGVCALLANDVSAAGGIIRAEACDGASSAAQERLAELHRRIESRGEDHNGADGEYRYLELVCRDPGGNRFDMPVGWMADDVDNSSYGKGTTCRFDHPGMPLEQEHEDSLEAFHSELDVIVSPVFQRLFDSYETDSDDESAAMSVASAGFLINRPGSTAQKWHKDGPDQGFIDAFVPLIDVSAELGPTEVQIGTHTDRKNFKQEDNEESSISFHESWEDMPYSVAPILKKGEILLLDYRTVHRGLGNMSHSTTRSLAYAVFKHENSSDGGTGGDVRNFPAATTLEYD